RDGHVTGVQTCALPISSAPPCPANTGTGSGSLRRISGSGRVRSPAVLTQMVTSLFMRLVNAEEKTLGASIFDGRWRDVSEWHLRSEERRVGKGWRGRWW